MDNSKQIENSNRLDEYKEIRQEVRLYLSERNSIKKFAYLLIFVVSGFIYKFDVEKTFSIFMLILIISLILIIWFQENRRAKAVIRLGSYIRFMIEPYCDGLKYETSSILYQEKHNTKFKLSKFGANLDFPLMVIFEFTFVIYLLNKIFDKCVALHYVIILLLLVLIIFFIIMICTTYDYIINERKKEDDIWRNIFNEMKMQK